VLEDGEKMSSVKSEIESIMNDSLENIRRVTNLILQKKIELF